MVTADLTVSATAHTVHAAWVRCTALCWAHGC
jgi:hypothetical protein